MGYQLDSRCGWIMFDEALAKVKCARCSETEALPEFTIDEFIRLVNRWVVDHANCEKGLEDIINS